MMKIRIIVLLAAFLLIGGNLYAANGDLTVNGALNVGAGGVKFPDNSVQTTANRLVWDYTVTDSAVPSVTSPALDGLAAGGYEFEFYIFNPSGTTATYRTYFNTDTTNSHYQYGAVWSNGAANASGGTDALILTSNIGASVHMVLNGTMNISPDGKISAAGTVAYVTTAGTLYAGTFSIARTQTDTNLTEVKIQSAGGNRIDVNSRFRLWKKN